MSLDVYLETHQTQSDGSGIFVREDGQLREISRAEWDEKFPNREPVVAKQETGEAYWRNITHNLAAMADAAGIYNVVWRPDENGIETASQLIEPLRAGLERLKNDPDTFKAHNPPNGWGNYEGLVEFIEDYLNACEQYPDAKVYASR